MTAEETVLVYAQAWSVQDAAERTALLERAWADDGVYQDPVSRAVGRQPLSDLIASFSQRMPGARVLLASGVDEHHGVLRFAWTIVDAAGAVAVDGFDVGELAADGRLRRITGFFGPFPPAPKSWPAQLVRGGARA